MTRPGICTESLAGCPDLLGLHALAPERYPFLLESTGGTSALARHDILFAFPGHVLTLDERWQVRGAMAPAGDFLDALDGAWRAEQAAVGTAPSLPFRGGWFVFLAYEFARQVEPGLRLEAEPGAPVARAVRIPAAVVRERSSGRTWALAEEGSERLLGVIRGDVRRLPAAMPRGAAPLLAGGVAEADPAEFLDAVERVRRHIAVGDIYQANISRRWEGRVAAGVTGHALYERLRVANPAPFSGLALLDGTAVVSSSPERLVRVQNGRVETRPIAGTRRRQGPEAPGSAHVGLVDNPKERAEHVMLIDLERNDLGRICEPGSVQVDEFMVVESYAHVHHIVSNVIGRLRTGTTPGEVLRAVFPGGTITGCPKVRCMEIIAAVERRPRGAYTGSMGYLNHDGSCDFNILIRTMSLSGDRLSLSAGSGIVADSVPERELDETRAKAKGMLLALV
jgi:anthranilate synthase component 1